MVEIRISIITILLWNHIYINIYSIRIYIHEDSTYIRQYTRHYKFKWKKKTASKITLDCFLVRLVIITHLTKRNEKKCNNNNQYNNEDNDGDDLAFTYRGEKMGKILLPNKMRLMKSISLIITTVYTSRIGKTK